jgi:uroporphyrinogen decarboxylase
MTASLQPLLRFETLDAVIFFSDILVIPQAMGMDVKMEKGRGPVFTAPLNTPADMSKLTLKPNVEAALGYVFDGINLTRKEINGRVPLIGFSGGPWTLMAYMVEGHGTKTWEKCKTWLYNHPVESHQLLQAVTDLLILYLVEQVKAGAQLLQVFESWGGELPPHLFKEFSVPYLRQIAAGVKAALPTDLKGKVPMTVFGRGLHHAVEDFANSEYDVIGLDWSQSPSEARTITGNKKALQGNLDPCALYGSEEVIRKEVRRMINEFGTKAYIANLGHGMHPSHSPTHAGYFIKAVQEISLEINKAK